MHDWKELKAEFISGKETLNQFRIRKELNKDWLYKKSKEGNWLEAREEVRTKAVTRVKQNVEDHLVAKWGVYLELWQDVLSRCKEFTKKENLTPQDCKAIAQSIDLALRSERLVRGESTGNIHSTNLNLHQIIVGELAKVSGRPGAFNITAEDLIDDRSNTSELPKQTLEAD